MLLDGHWGSICHLRGSIGAHLGRHWAPLVAFGVPLGRLWGSLGVTLRSLREHFFTCGHFEHFYQFGDFCSKKKRAMERPNCEQNTIFSVLTEESKKQFLPPKNVTSISYASL